jgi:hypothetical protein
MAFDLGGFGGGVGQMQSSKASAAGYAASARSLREAARLTAISTKLKLAQADREIYKVTGGARADIAASGLAASGSALDVIRSNAQQGGLQKAVTGLQGQIEYTGLIGQAEQAEAQAKAAKKGGKGGIGSIIGGAATVAMAFSDDRLKEDILLIGRREDGIGIYQFRYLGDGLIYMGVLASEVERLKPDAVWKDERGFRHVDYQMIQADLRCLGSSPEAGRKH